MHQHQLISFQTLRSRALAVFILFSVATVNGIAVGDEVGDVSVDWLGGDIKIEAIEDPKVAGITCHVSYFDRGLLDRLRNGQIFSDPSNSAIDCRQTGPIVIGDIDLSSDGESVFSQRTSLVWKSLKVTRIYDKDRDTLLYLSHASQVAEGSAKMDLSTIPLFDAEVVWEK
jgi:CreA protein